MLGTMSRSGKLILPANAASPSATPPKTIELIMGKPGRRMVSSRKAANLDANFYCTSRKTKRKQIGS
ncbi:MAG: hypothetical protein DMF28_10690 [Verrucomicrobia bacterium]|nr:MAG: hypothetical protein DMF28_10690 [Verrucomicrobiota bacterium]